MPKKGELRKRRNGANIRIYDLVEGKELRPKVMELRGGTCLICGTTNNVQVHHLNYTRPTDPETCILLCSRHHGMVDAVRLRHAHKKLVGCDLLKIFVDYIDIHGVDNWRIENGKTIQQKQG